MSIFDHVRMFPCRHWVLEAYRQVFLDHLNSKDRLSYNRVFLMIWNRLSRLQSRATRRNLMRSLGFKHSLLTTKQCYAIRNGSICLMTIQSLLFGGFVLYLREQLWRIRLIKTCRLVSTTYGKLVVFLSACSQVCHRLPVICFHEADHYYWNLSPAKWRWWLFEGLEFRRRRSPWQTSKRYKWFALSSAEWNLPHC